MTHNKDPWWRKRQRLFTVPDGFVQIPGLPEGYWAHRDGRIGSTRSGEFRVRAPVLTDRGYYHYTITFGDKNKNMKGHILVARTFIPGDWSLQVNHKNGIKTDNDVDNLEWLTNAENLQHSYDTKLRIPKTGANSHRALFTWEQVDEIHARSKAGEGFASIARAFACGETTIAYIIKGKTYVR